MGEERFRGKTLTRKKVLILVEGQTEETFIKRVLTPHLQGFDVSSIPTILVTKRTQSAMGFRGGVPSYPRVRTEILRLLGDTSARLVTTMIDYYALPHSFPGMQTPLVGNAYKRVAQLETAWYRDIKDSRFIPYLSVHEFEALLFSCPSAIAAALGRPSLERKLERELSRAGSPEEIDDGPDTHPSKRLSHYYPAYKKVIDGANIVTRIGIEMIRGRCPHFDEWVGRLETC